MKIFQKYGFIIFALGTTLSTTLFALNLGALIHIQTYKHGSLVFNILDTPFFLSLFFVALACIPIGLALIFLKTKLTEIKKMLKFFAIIFLITGLTAGLAFGAGLQSDLDTRHHVRWNEIDKVQEKIAIQGAHYDANNNSLSLFVQSMNIASNNATFTNAIIKDPTGNIVTAIPISYTLIYTQIKIVTVNVSLISGTYTTVLVTANGSSFVSPVFTVPYQSMIQ